MKKAESFALALIFLFAFLGCAPDLVVKDLQLNWDPEPLPPLGSGVNKKAKAEIANIGNKDAGRFLVYFDGEEDPVSPTRRPQVSKDVPHLAKGDSIHLEADFAPLAHRDNNYLENVKKILVIADPKGMVKEKNENNNEREIPVP